MESHLSLSDPISGTVTINRTISHTPTPILFEFNSKFRSLGDITDYTVFRTIPQSGTVKVISINIPFTHDVIHAPCNMLTFTECKYNMERKAPVPEGNYSVEELCLVLEQLMTAYGSQSYKVTEQKGILRIDADSEFKLTWTDTSIWSQLGFLPREYQGPIWRALLPPNLSPSGMYYLDIGMTNTKLYNAVCNVTRYKEGIIPLMLKGNCYELANWKNTTMSPVAVIPNRTQTRIQLLDSRGEIVKLKQDWSFILENIP